MLFTLEFNSGVESEGVGIHAGILKTLQFVAETKVQGLDKLDGD